MSRTEEKEIQLTEITEAIKLCFGDEKTAEYIRQIIKSETAKRYWRHCLKDDRIASPYMMNSA